MNRQRNRRNILALWAITLMAITCTCQAETVLDRIMKVQDPELSACLRLAIKNFEDRYHGSEDIKLELIRKVTEFYTQIKLYDTQIEHLEIQLNRNTNPDSLRHELFLAKAELESKRDRIIAQLRETMFIIPRYQGGQIPRDQLVDHLFVDIVDAHLVWIYRCTRPGFYPYFDLLEKAPLDDAQTCASRIFALLKGHPTRIDIQAYGPYQQTVTILQQALQDIVAQKHLELDTDLRCMYHAERRRISWDIVNGRVVLQRNQKDNGIYSVESSWAPTDPDELQRRLKDRFDPKKNPGLHNAVFQLEHDEVSVNTAKTIAEQARLILKEFGLEATVTVELVPTQTHWVE